MENSIKGLLILLLLISCNMETKKATASTMESEMSKSICNDDCQAKSNDTNFTCKLTSSELQERKSSVIKTLKSKLIIKKEIDNGYLYKFSGTNEMLDDLVEFIKTERECCSFFSFNLSISGDQSESWLEITGPEGVKEFIDIELEI